MEEKKQDTLCYQVSDLCELLGVSKPTAYTLVHREDFPKVRVGRRLLVPRAGLERWLETQSSIESEGGAA